MEFMGTMKILIDAALLMSLLHDNTNVTDILSLSVSFYSNHRNTKVVFKYVSKLYCPQQQLVGVHNSCCKAPLYWITSLKLAFYQCIFLIEHLLCTINKWGILSADIAICCYSINVDTKLTAHALEMKRS